MFHLASSDFHSADGYMEYLTLSILMESFTLSFKQLIVLLLPPLFRVALVDPCLEALVRP